MHYVQRATDFLGGFRLTNGACLIFLRQLGKWLILGASACALAQTNEEVFREYQFNFNLPGARATGMGGAFIGIADDATSSFTNPAGLAFLSDTALTLEYRDRRIDERTGEIQGSFNTVFTQESVNLENVGFLSFNARWRGWYFGVFQYDYLDEFQQRTFRSRSFSEGGERIENRNILLDLSGKTRGFGIARRMGAWKFGISVNAMQLRGRMDYDRDGSIIGPDPEIVFYESAIDDDDNGWGFNVGILHEVNETFTWGLVWREHPNFALDESVFEERNDQPVLSDTFQTPFVVPDVLGVGARYRLLPTLSLTADWQHIFYSQIIEDGFIIVESLTSESKTNYQIDDTDEFHVGAEWLLPADQMVWAFRTGYYRNPLHAVTYSGNDPAIQDRFAGTGLTDEDHWTVGVGWVFRNRLEVDISFNTWDVGREITASLIWRQK